MKTISRIIISLAIVVLCTSSMTFNADAEITGRWSIIKGLYWDIKTNGTYRLVSGPNFIEGRYTIKNDELTLIETSSKGLPRICQNKEAGIYKFVLTENTLRVWEKKDPCSNRPLALSGAYKRQ